jgi:ABC-type polysaccharide/polyol phosphate export permease
MGVSVSAGDRVTPMLSAPPKGENPVREIRAVKRRVRFRDVFSHWPLIWQLALRDYQVRFKQAALGPIWVLAQPLAILLALTVVFQEVTTVDTGGVPYAAFALPGITVWTFVTTCLAMGSRTFIANKKLVTKVACPRTPFVTSSILSAAPNLVFPLVLTIVVVVVTTGLPPVQFALLPVVLVLLIGLVWSVTLVLASLNVRLRDVANFVPFLLQGGLFLTPIGYPLSSVDGLLEVALYLNPLSGIIEALRWTLTGGSLDLVLVGITAGMTGLAMAAGWMLFSRLEVRFADII